MIEDSFEHKGIGRGRGRETEAEERERTRRQKGAGGKRTEGARAEARDPRGGPKKEKHFQMDDYNEVKSQGAGLILDPFTGSP